MTVTLYGIPNCDTVKKARQWLEVRGIVYGFHDFKKQGVTAELLQQWLAQIPLETLVNRKGTTWRKLNVDQQTQAAEPTTAIALMCANPSLIKRPVLIKNQIVNVGFSSESYENIFS